MSNVIAVQDFIIDRESIEQISRKRIMSNIDLYDQIYGRINAVPLLHDIFARSNYFFFRNSLQQHTKLTIVYEVQYV